MKRSFISILAVLTLIGLLGLAEMSLAVEGTFVKPKRRKGEKRDV